MALSPESHPRDAASLVIVDHANGEPRVLLGKRRTTQVFAPGKFVFPGGSVDPADAALVTSERLSTVDRFALNYQPGASAAQLPPETFALAAIRETFEEAGLLFGRPLGGLAASQAPDSWLPILALGAGPNLAPLTFIARAITPPRRPRRFDARFFLADARHISHRLPTTDGEFEALDWFNFAAAARLDLHGMTREIIAETGRFLALSAIERQAAPVPFYVEGPAGWQRNLIYRSAPPANS